ncbi:hypothetical protein GH714_042263 [Hevea brasiliensis]|uniref:Uncharacterized protein n=1 Tax=Hevea brasiliensis TaxID=3981 RepID=A0A6A6MSQ1_HEVBR|nr:hypothetical protein GH714_042263 [Hevea brasiliensis]
MFAHSPSLSIERKANELNEEKEIKHPTMDLISCSFCSTLHSKSASLRQFLSTNRTSYNSTSAKCRLKTTSELQTPVGVTGRDGYHSPSIPIHKVTVRDRQRGLVHEFLVPEDASDYLYFAYDFSLTGHLISFIIIIAAKPENTWESILRKFVMQGYALLCVGFPSSDLEVETQDEDEVYWLQFGRYFARGPIERDDYALELAMGDE